MGGRFCGLEGYLILSEIIRQPFFWQSRAARTERKIPSAIILEKSQPIIWTEMISTEISRCRVVAFRLVCCADCRRCIKTNNNPDAGENADRSVGALQSLRLLRVLHSSVSSAVARQRLVFLLRCVGATTGKCFAGNEMGRDDGPDGLISALDIITLGTRTCGCECVSMI